MEEKYVRRFVLALIVRPPARQRIPLAHLPELRRQPSPHTPLLGTVGRSLVRSESTIPVVRASGVSPPRGRTRSPARWSWLVLAPTRQSMPPRRAAAGLGRPSAPAAAAEKVPAGFH